MAWGLDARAPLDDGILSSALVMTSADAPVTLVEGACLLHVHDARPRPGFLSLATEGSAQNAVLHIRVAGSAEEIHSLAERVRAVQLTDPRCPEVIEVDVLEVRGVPTLFDPEWFLDVIARPRSATLGFGAREGDVTRSVTGHLYNVSPIRGRRTKASRGGFARETSEHLNLTVAGWEVLIDSVRPWVHERGWAFAEDEDVPEDDDPAIRWMWALTHSHKHAGALITHVVQLRKANGATFNTRNAHSVLDRIESFLGFAFGRRTPVLHRYGWHPAGHASWIRFDTAPQLGQFTGGRSPRSWLPPQVSSPTAEEAGRQAERELSAALRGFFQVYDEHREVLGRAIEWYVAALATEGTSACLVLAQAGLELLAFHRLSIQMRMTEHSRQKVEAADQIRVLLSLADVSPEIPDALPSLRALKVDGPECVTRARNRAVHPSPVGLSSRITEEHTRAAEALALHYLELALLRLIGHRGLYWNRVDDLVEPVPWAGGSHPLTGL